MRKSTVHNTRVTSTVLVLAATIVCVVPGGAAAQDPLKVVPHAYKLQFENEYARVIWVRYGPLEKLPTHDHPQRRTVFIYLNDSGPVRFKHVEGYSGNYAATRPPTKKGAYRLAGVQPENHEVENLSELPSEFLQVEVKTEALNPATFRGRFFREPLHGDLTTVFRRVEFDNEDLRISRVICPAGSVCGPAETSAQPAMVVALSSMDIEPGEAKNPAGRTSLNTGQTVFFDSGEPAHWRNGSKKGSEALVLEFKSKPKQSSEAIKPHKHGHF